MSPQHWSSSAAASFVLLALVLLLGATPATTAATPGALRWELKTNEHNTDVPILVTSDAMYYVERESDNTPMGPVQTDRLCQYPYSFGDTPPATDWTYGGAGSFLYMDWDPFIVALTGDGSSNLYVTLMDPLLPMTAIWGTVISSHSTAQMQDSSGRGRITRAARTLFRFRPRRCCPPTEPLSTGLNRHISLIRAK